MTALERYNELPKDVQFLIDDYMTWFDSAEDCLETLISIAPNKESSIRALLEAYGNCQHQYLTIKEKLEGIGISDSTAYQMGMACFLAK